MQFGYQFLCSHLGFALVSVTLYIKNTPKSLRGEESEKLKKQLQSWSYVNSRSVSRVKMSCCKMGWEQWKAPKRTRHRNRVWRVRACEEGGKMFYTCHRVGVANVLGTQMVRKDWDKQRAVGSQWKFIFCWLEMAHCENNRQMVTFRNYLLLFHFCLCFETVSICSPDCLGTHLRRLSCPYTLETLLALRPDCWIIGMPHFAWLDIFICTLNSCFAVRKLDFTVCMWISHIVVIKCQQ